MASISIVRSAHKRPALSVVDFYYVDYRGTYDTHDVTDSYDMVVEVYFQTTKRGDVISVRLVRVRVHTSDAY